MSVVIAENAGREVLLVSPSRPTSTSTAYGAVVRPSTTSTAAVPSWLPSSTGRRPSRSARTPPMSAATVLPRPKVPSTSPTNDGVRSSSSVR